MAEFADIAFQRASGNTLDLFTYKIPQNLEVKAGQLVKVPFLRGSRNGLVFNTHQKAPAFATKDIEELISLHPLLNKWQIELIKWIANHYFCSIHTVLKQFIPSNIFENKAVHKRKREKPLAEKLAPPKTLTPKQQEAFDEIIQSKKQKFLLHGVTGAGKTEIYLQLAKTLKKNEQFLLLVPEISLTPQLIQYFQKNFKEEVLSIHSRLSIGEKREIWGKIKNGEAKVVIGSRSAIFAPFNNLKYIIIDEEQEWSYKQDQSPRYHTRSVAEKICELLPELKLILGSATPSIESYHKTETGEYKLLQLPERASKIHLPDVHIVDLREELHKGNYSIFSDILLEKISEKLKKKEQILLFLNKRGSASAVVCRDCGQNIKCKHCDVSLTYHNNVNKEARLICHYCGIIEKPPKTCPNCSSPYIKFIGIGTQKVESEIKKLFPSARVLRADKDTTAQKDSFKEIYKKLQNHEVDILIGTQMIGKGLHLPKINLVGVILADIGLHIPDFRSSEKTFQLMTQVAGRAGRVNKGEVIIQSYLPTHPAIKLASNHDFESFFTYEIKNRKETSYPPFTEIIRLLISDKNKEACKKEHQRILKLLEDRKEDTEVLAHPAMIEKIHNKYRYIITLKGQDPSLILQDLLPELSRWKIDRDPYWS